MGSDCTVPDHCLSFYSIRLLCFHSLLAWWQRYKDFDSDRRDTVLVLILSN